MPPASERRWAAVHIASLFLGAFLLFTIQPLVGRMLLPGFGGVPAVWTTALVFFQCVLLVGYAYAHATVERLGPRRQMVLQALIVILAALVLPPRLLVSGDGLVGWPAARVLVVLAVAVGAPFLVLSANSTLVQRWYADAGLAARREPYRLYAASNLGSVLGLLAVPFALDPLLGVRRQAAAWSLGYAVFAALTLALVVHARRRAPAAPNGSGGQFDPAGGGPPGSLGSPAGSNGRSGAAGATPVASGAAASAARPPGVSRGRQIGWAARAGVATSLLQSVTTALTTDVAPVPLLWVVPLLVYLLTFIVAFGWPDRIGRPWLVGATATTLAASVALLAWPIPVTSLALAIGVPVATLAAGALLCHVDVANDRPDVAHLTRFYLWVSAGGALGGVLNSLVAPAAFDWVAEYPLTLVAMAALVSLPPRRPVLDGEHGLLRARAWVVPGLVVAGVFVAAAVVRFGDGRGDAALFVPYYALLVGLVLTPLAGRWRRPALRLSFAGAVAGGAVFATVVYQFGPHLVARDRNFFGVRQVFDTEGVRIMMHGNTGHGAQSLDPARRGVPRMYYHPSTPMGRLVAAEEPTAAIGLVGLGTGALVALGRPGQRFVFYEIDPLSETMARSHFTYLSDTPATVEVVIADGRLALQGAPDRTFDLLIVDAFNSDSVPTHLLTVEALRLYLAKIEREGLVAFHISNRYLDLEPVVAGIVADVGAAAALAAFAPTDAQRADGASASIVAAVSADPATIDRLLGQADAWRPLDPAGAVAWSDDHVNLLPVLCRSD